MKQILIGTNNVSKARMFRGCLEPLGLSCVTLSEAGITAAAPENERTAAGNAVFKARAYHQASGMAVLAEDSALLLPDLPPDDPDQPGVLVRRAAGHEMTDEEMLRWFSALAARHGGSTAMGWLNAWCFINEAGEEFVYADTPETVRLFSYCLVSTPCQARVPGWPLDSITWVPSLKKYAAELTEADQAALDAQQEAERAACRARYASWLQAVTR